MLAVSRPAVLMDPFDPYRHHSDYNPVNRTRLQGSQRSNQSKPPSLPQQHQQQQSQQQLPSFKEILPPPLHSAIDSTSQRTTQQPLLSDPSGSSSQGPNRAVISSQPSPNYSQSSSMPDSFDDFAIRHSESSIQLSTQQRNPPSWTASPQYTEMAATYGTQRPAYQSHGMGVSRPSPGLPPIRDIGQGLSKYASYDSSYLASNGPYSQMYSQPGTAHHDSSHYGARRDSQYYDNNRGYSNTYPTSGQQYDNGRYQQPYSYTNMQYSRGEPHSNFPYSSLMGNAHSPVTPSGSTYEAADSRNRRRRGNLPKHITDILRTWFQDHLDHPYPSEEEKQMFMVQTGLTINQISNWFINARRRHLPAMKTARDSRVKQEAEGHRQTR